MGVLAGISTGGIRSSSSASHSAAICRGQPEVKDCMQVTSMRPACVRDTWTLPFSLTFGECVAAQGYVKNNANAQAEAHKHDKLHPKNGHRTQSSTLQQALAALVSKLLSLALWCKARSVLGGWSANGLCP